MEELDKNAPYRFKVLWSKNGIGVAVNQQYKENLETPLTSFYFWPREDGWKLLKAELNSKPWMDERSKTDILNGYTKVVDFWLTNLDKKVNNLNLQTNSLNLDIIGVYSSI